MKTYHILFFTHLLSILFTFSPRTQISVLNTMLVKAPPVSHVHVHKIYKTGVAFFVKGFLLASVPTFKIAKTENHCFFYGIFPIREMILCLQSSIFPRNLTEIEQLLPQAVLLVSRSKRGRALASPPGPPFTSTPASSLHVGFSLRQTVDVTILRKNRGLKTVYWSADSGSHLRPLHWNCSTVEPLHNGHFGASEGVWQLSVNLTPVWRCNHTILCWKGWLRPW